MKVHLTSLGCARNQIDSEVMLGRLKSSGAVITDDPAEAEVIIVNTCSFIESAADESIDTILELAKYKLDGNCRRLAVTGCLPERYRDDIVQAIPEVDVFLGTGAFNRIVEVLDDYPDSARCILPDPDSLVPSSAVDPRVRSLPHMAYLKVAEGCSKHCTYCIIPKLRGKQKSRPTENIVAEAQQLIQSGVRELVLVAQDTTAYGQDLNGRANLANLLQQLAELPPSRTPNDDHVTGAPPFWIRFLYGHPESIDEAVIKTVADYENICSYFDIPIQHGSNTILKKMGRGHSRGDIYRLVDRIKTIIPEAAIRTTVIVGFPGETEVDFEDLMELVKDVRFNHLGCFIYSDAEDLPSHHLPDHVPESVAKDRFEALMSYQAGISLEHNQKYIGKTIPVLIEERQEDNLFTGRTALQAPEVDGMIYVHGTQLQKGCFTDIKINDALEYDLVGKPI